MNTKITDWITLVLLALLLPAFTFPAAALEVPLSGSTSLTLYALNSDFSVTTSSQLTDSASVSTDVLCTPQFSIDNQAGILTVSETGAGGCVIQVTLPELAIPVKIETGNGEIAVSGKLSQLTIAGGNGPVTVVSGVFSMLVASSSNGSVKFNTVSSGSISVSTDNGSISATGISGQMDVRTKNGKITIRKFSLPAASRNVFRSGNGRIKLTGLSIPKSSGLRVNALASNGRVSFKGKGWRRQVRSGWQIIKDSKKAVQIYARCSNGDISVTD